VADWLLHEEAATRAELRILKKRDKFDLILPPLLLLTCRWHVPRSAMQQSSASLVSL
jgi:hypothetical protein